MLSEELLVISKTVQGEIAVIDGLDWFRKLDKARQRSAVSSVSMCLERANPNQAGIDKVYERWERGISTHVSDIFREWHHDQAIKKATEVPDKELGNSYIILIEMLRHFDELQRKTICKYGCDHEWHNLSWIIRTDNIEAVVDFYTLAGLKPEYRKHGSGFSYTRKNGQSILKIYSLPKTKKDKGLGLRIKFAIEDFDGVIKKLKEKQVSFLDETFTMATVVDPDGRKIELHKS